MAQAIEGYYENGTFFPLEQIFSPVGRRRAFVTIMDELAETETESQRQLAALRELRDDIRKSPELPPEFDEILNRRVSIKRELKI